jgi:hypothetical protein
LKGNRDYNDLSGVPKWIGNQASVGHAGGFYQPNGGAFAKAAVAWLQWTLQGSATGAEYFTGSGVSADGWSEVQSADLDQLTTGGAATGAGSGNATVSAVASSVAVAISTSAAETASTVGAEPTTTEQCNIVYVYA